MKKTTKKQYLKVKNTLKKNFAINSKINFSIIILRSKYEINL